MRHHAGIPIAQATHHARERALHSGTTKPLKKPNFATLTTA
jgi:hypothetical protein